jgi:hypothetical protein
LIPIDNRMVEIVADAFRWQITVTHVLTRSGVAASTWNKWRKGVLPVTPKKIAQIRQALDEMIVEAKKRSIS